MNKYEKASQEYGPISYLMFDISRKIDELKGLISQKILDKAQAQIKNLDEFKKIKVALIPTFPFKTFKAQQQKLKKSGWQFGTIEHALAITSKMLLYMLIRINPASSLREIFRMNNSVYRKFGNYSLVLLPGSAEEDHNSIIFPHIYVHQRPTMEYKTESVNEEMMMEWKRNGGTVIRSEWDNDHFAYDYTYVSYPGLLRGNDIKEINGELKNPFMLVSGVFMFLIVKEMD